MPTRRFTIFISHRMIVRCVYPVQVVNHLVLEQNFQAQSPGVGSVQLQPPRSTPDMGMEGQGVGG